MAERDPQKIRGRTGRRVELPSKGKDYDLYDAVAEAIWDSGLSPGARLLAKFLLEHVDWHTWAKPALISATNHCAAEWGLSIPYMHRKTGLSEGHISKLIRVLQREGLLLIFERYCMPHGYRLVPEAFLARAEARRRAAEAGALERADAIIQRERDRRAREAADGVDAPELDSEPASTAPDAPAGSQELPGGADEDAPAWAVRRVADTGQPAAVIAELVRGVSRLLFGADDDMTLVGQARPICRLWREADYCAPADLLAELELQVDAARHDPSEAWDDLRGHRAATPWAGNLRALLFPSRWAVHRARAQRWAAAKAGQPDPTPPRGPEGTWTPPGQPAAPPAVDVAALREAVPARLAGVEQLVDEMAWTLWLRPLRVDLVTEEGLVVLEAPTPEARAWVGELYIEVLVRALQAPVGLRVAAPPGGT